MGADIDISKFLHPLDLVSPVEAALHLREARENETTQRMYAQNQMARQSAADFRDERDHREKLAKEEEDRKIAQAGALERAQQMMRSPGGLGPAQALMEAYGGHLNPLTAAVAPPPPQGDATDQLLASPEGAAAAMPAAGPGPVEGPAPAPGVQSGGMAPVTAADRLGPGAYPLEGPQQLQHAPEGDFLLPTAMHVSPGMQGAMDHQGFVPRGAEPLQPPAGPGAPAAAGDLESLMSRAAPQPTAKPEAPPMPLLYEAVLGARHYPISAEQAKTSLGPKYDQIFQQYMSMPGAHPEAAFKAVMAEKEKDDAQAATEHRMLAVLGGRNDQQDARDSRFKLTVDEQKQREADREANARTVARIRAAAAGASTPQQQQALAQMIGMKEQGAPDSEIAAFGAQNHVDPKVWNAPVKNVDTEAVAGSRATERRASMEYVSPDGTMHGVTASPQARQKLIDKDSQFGLVKQRMEDMIADVKANGTRVSPTNPDAYQKRLSNGAAMQAALAPYNGLGGSDATRHLEAQITGSLGTPGQGFLFGANPDILEKVLREATEKHARDIKSALRPGGGAPLPAAITHDRPKTADPIDAQLDWARSLPGARR